MDLLSLNGDSETERRLRSRLQLYRAKQPYREWPDVLDHMAYSIVNE